MSEHQPAWGKRVSTNESSSEFLELIVHFLICVNVSDLCERIRSNISKPATTHTHATDAREEETVKTYDTRVATRDSITLVSLGVVSEQFFVPEAGAQYP